MKDVHTEHCCIFHGCKYGKDETCTVMTKMAPQSYRCELCESDGIDIRPWGSYQVLVDAPTHKVKTITIKAGKRLSLQRHLKRSERWICVEGKLTVFRCSHLAIEHSLKNPLCTVRIDPGEMVGIHEGQVHRAEARDGDVTFIEVQIGSYFGEDDIIRYQDDYGRQ